MSKYFDDQDLFVGPKTEQYGGQLVTTGVKRDTKIKYLNVDTMFRDNYNTSNLIDYNITFPDTITNIKSITVTDMEVPGTFYKISENFGNNVFTIVNNNTNVTTLIKVKDDDYTETGLRNVINQYIQVTYPLIGMTVSDHKCVFYSFAQGESFTFNFAVNQEGGFQKNNFQSSLGYLLGYRTPQIVLNYGESVKSAGVINIEGPRYLFLAVDEMNGNGSESGFLCYLPNSQINRSILARKSMEQNIYGVRTTDDFTSDKRTYAGLTTIKRLNVKLLDEFGKVVDLNGSNVSFCLKIEHE